MMNTKYFIYALALFTTQTVWAQNVDKEYITPSEVAIREMGDRLQVSLKLTPGGKAMKKMEKVKVTPSIVGSTGESQSLEPFMLYGKSRRKIEIRNAKLQKRTAPKEKKVYVYDVDFPFQPWMEKAKLVVDLSKTSCANCPEGNTRVQIPVLVELAPREPYVMKPMPNFIMPEAEPIKNRAETGSARIAFLSGKSVIMPEYKGNATELEKINTAIRQVLADTLAQVSDIVLTAYSSPEGAYATNERLSKARAEGLKGYVQANNELKGVSVQTKAVAEDWETLRDMIVKSEYSWKEAALKIIDGTDIPDNREKGLKTLVAGKAYRMMLQEWFPQLRRTDYRLDYSVKDFTVEQGREIIRTRPAQLSLNEMFHVANSYPKGSPEFNEVFDIAVRLFPENPVANINAAASAISRGDTTMAKKYLDKVGDDLRVANNRATYYMLNGDTQKAKECLDSIKEKTQETEHNLNEIRLKEENNALLEKYGKR